MCDLLGGLEFFPALAIFVADSPTSPHVSTDSINQAIQAESAGNYLQALQLYKQALVNEATWKKTIARDEFLELIQKKSALLESLQNKSNHTLFQGVVALQKNNLTSAIKQKLTKLMGNTTEYLTMPEAIQNRLVQATLVLRSADGAVLENRQIVLTRVVAYDPLEKELTYEYVNQPGRMITDYPDIEAPAAELYMSFQTPLPSTPREEAGIKYSVPPLYKQEFVVSASTAVVCKSQLRLYNADTIHYSSFTPSSAYQENNSPLGYPAANFMPQSDNTYAAYLTVHDGLLKASSMLTYVHNCSYETSGSAPYMKCSILAGQKVSLLAGSQATLSLSSTSTTKPVLQTAPVTGRRLAQSSSTSTTCPDITFDGAITAPITDFSPGCLPPFVRQGFSSIEYSSLPGTGTSTGSATAASTAWRKNSLPVYSQNFTAASLNAGGVNAFGPSNRFCTESVSSSNVYSSADFLSTQQSTVSVSGAYSAPFPAMTSLSAAASASFGTADASYTTSSQFGLVTQVVATQGTVNLPNVFATNAAPDPNFLDNIVALLNQVNITQSDTATQGTLNDIMFNFYEFYGDSVMTSVELGAFFMTTVSTSTSSIASSASSGTSATATLNAIAGNTAASISGSTVSATENGQDAQNNDFSSGVTVAPPFMSSMPGNVGALNFTCPSSGPCQPDSLPWCDEYGAQPVSTLWATFVSGSIAYGGPGGLFNLPTAQFWTNAPWPTPFLQANFQTLLPQLATFYATFIESCVNSTGAFVDQSSSAITCATGTNACTGYNFPTNTAPPYSSSNPACDSCLTGVTILQSNGVCSVGGTEYIAPTGSGGGNTFLPNTLGCSASGACVCSSAVPFNINLGNPSTNVNGGGCGGGTWCVDIATRS